MYTDKKNNFISFHLSLYIYSIRVYIFPDLFVYLISSRAVDAFGLWRDWIELCGMSLLIIPNTLASRLCNNQGKRLKNSTHGRYIHLTRYIPGDCGTNTNVQENVSDHTFAFPKVEQLNFDASIRGLLKSQHVELYFSPHKDLEKYHGSKYILRIYCFPSRNRLTIHQIPSRAMYSPANIIIIIGAALSALLGFYVFVPGGSLRVLDYWLNIRQPILGDAPVIVDFLLFEQDVIKLGPFQYFNDGEIMESLQVLSDILGPVIGPRIPLRAEPAIVPLPLRFLPAVTAAVSSLWPYLVICLAVIALTKKSWDLRNLQKCHEDEKKINLKQLEQKSKEHGDMKKAHGEQAQKFFILDEALKQNIKEHLDTRKANDEKAKKLVDLEDALEQRTKEHFDATKVQIGLGELLEQKTKDILDTKKANFDLDDLLKQEFRKLLDMAQGYDEKAKKAETLGDEFMRKTKELLNM